VRATVGGIGVRRWKPLRGSARFPLQRLALCVEALEDFNDFLDRALRSFFECRFSRS